MGFWSSISSALGSSSSIGSAIRGISSSSSQEKEEDPTYKKYADEIRNFKLEDKDEKTAPTDKKQDVQLNQMQDALGDIDSIDDVKKHFQEK